MDNSQYIDNIGIHPASGLKVIQNNVYVFALLNINYELVIGQI